MKGGTGDAAGTALEALGHRRPHQLQEPPHWPGVGEGGKHRALLWEAPCCGGRSGDDDGGGSTQRTTVLPPWLWTSSTSSSDQSPRIRRGAGTLVHTRPGIHPG